MNRIFYFNLNYECNQDCRFCFSHNTHRHTFADRRVDCPQFMSFIELERPRRGDRIVFSGGEPTLHPELPDLLTAAVETGSEVVLYTNGSALESRDLASRVVKSGVSRITIPIHGNESEHDFMTSRKGSYARTVSGVRNVCEMSSRKLVEFKFIVTNAMAEKAFDISHFLFENRLLPFCLNVVISGQVETLKSIRRGLPRVESETYGRYVGRQVCRVVECASAKVFDFRLCMFDMTFQRWLLALPEEVNDSFCEFRFYDARSGSMRKRSYDMSRAEKCCLSCGLQPYCRSIQESYLILLLKDNGKSLALE